MSAPTVNTHPCHILIAFVFVWRSFSFRYKQKIIDRCSSPSETANVAPWNGQNGGIGRTFIRAPPLSLVTIVFRIRWYIATLWKSNFRSMFQASFPLLDYGNGGRERHFGDEAYRWQTKFTRSQRCIYLFDSLFEISSQAPSRLISLFLFNSYLLVSILDQVTSFWKVIRGVQKSIYEVIKPKTTLFQIPLMIVLVWYRNQSFATISWSKQITK